MHGHLRRMAGRVERQCMAISVAWLAGWGINPWPSASHGWQRTDLIHDEHLACVELGHTLLGEVQDAAGGGHDNVHAAMEAHDVVLE
jgi:hypothetical protein